MSAEYEGAIMAEANDWEYRCTSCGHQVTVGADFNEPCPSCGSHGWMCHWLKKPGATPGKSADNVSQARSSESQGWDKIFSEKYPVENLSQPENNKPGPKSRGLPGDLINQLSQQGLSSRQIAADLGTRGFHISYKSIQRYLRRQKQGGLL